MISFTVTVNGTLYRRQAEARMSEAQASLQRIIEAENSDLFDVLAYVAFALHPQTREARADQAKVLIHSNYSDKQRGFLEFVLAQYVKQGVEELDQDKLSPLLRLKYHNAIQDAVADLGSVEEIRDAFTGFQRFLYESVG